MGLSLTMLNHTCYLPPDTSERAPPNPSQKGWYSINLVYGQNATGQNATAQNATDQMPPGRNATQKIDSRTKCHREINIPGQNAKMCTQHKWVYTTRRATHALFQNNVMLCLLES